MNDATSAQSTNVVSPAVNSKSLSDNCDDDD